MPKELQALHKGINDTYTNTNSNANTNANTK